MRCVGPAMTATRRDRKGRAPRDAERWTRAAPRSPAPSSRHSNSLAEDALHPRDRGPVRAHVRDLVDAHRRLVGLFAPAFGGTLIAALGPESSLQRWLLLGCAVLLAVAVVDAVLLGRTVARSARARFPGIPVDTLRTGWYAFMRAHRMRSMRLPPPRVDLGDPVP
jgi:hypothetical protein